MRNRFGFISVVFTAALILLGLGYWAFNRSPAELTAEEIADRKHGRPGVPLPVLWDAPAFDYPDQNGHRVTKADLRGHVWIADFFFTSCTTICPLMTARMAQLQKTLSTSNIHFVSFSVDPDHDTPAVLKQYSKMWEADDSRWHFLSTQRKTLAETAAGMKTFVIPPDADGQVQHSSIFILTDSNGQVRGIYDSADAVALQRLTADALTLAGAPTPKQPAALASWSLPGKQSDTSPGAKLYVSRGCAPCHAQVHVAPLLDGCFGRKVILQDGSSVLSDEAYLRESILDPTAQIVAGYAPLMPSYRDKLTDTELSRLVDYLKSLPAAPVSEAPAGSSQPPASGEVVDLVCQMRVPVRDSTLHTEWEGKTYYFCSPMCREQFQKNPTKFVSRPSTPHQQKGISP